MKKYQLRRAIRQTASLTPPPITSTTPEYDAATLGGLLRYAADELIAKYPGAQAVEVRVLDKPYSDFAAPLEWVRLDEDGDVIVDGALRVVSSVISARVMPSRFAIRHGDGPVMDIYAGYAELLRTMFLYRQPKGSDTIGTIARERGKVTR